MNKIILSGEIKNLPEYSHEVFGEKFYKFEIETVRRSGTVDKANCIISETLVQEVQVGLMEVIGEIRTRNINTVVLEEDSEKKKSTLEITVFVIDIYEYLGIAHRNEVQITGFICKKPTYRITNNDRQISEFVIASNRERSHRSDYIPCISWGRNAARTHCMNIGDEVSVFGRFQSREYIKKIEGDEFVKTAYELSISRIEILDKESEELS